MDKHLQGKFLCYMSHLTLSVRLSVDMHSTDFYKQLIKEIKCFS